MALVNSYLILIQAPGKSKHKYCVVACSQLYGRPNIRLGEGIQQLPDIPFFPIILNNLPILAFYFHKFYFKGQFLAGQFMIGINNNVCIGNFNNRFLNHPAILQG